MKAYEVISKEDNEFLDKAIVLCTREEGYEFLMPVDAVKKFIKQVYDANDYELSSIIVNEDRWKFSCLKMYGTVQEVKLIA
jgi:hypothetical protein